MLRADDYPTLVDFMRKCLYQGAGPTFEDATRMWLLTGEQSVQRVVQDIDRLLSDGHSEGDLAEFVDNYSDYAEDGGAAPTLRHIKAVLRGAGLVSCFWTQWSFRVESPSTHSSVKDAGCRWSTRGRVEPAPPGFALRVPVGETL